MFDLKDTENLLTRLGPLPRPAEHLVEFEQGTFRFIINALTYCATLPWVVARIPLNNWDREHWKNRC